MLNPLSYILAFSHCLAFILLMLVSLGMPVIKSLYILQFRNAHSQAASTITLRLGIWGYCVTRDANKHDCTGYTTDSNILGDTEYKDVGRAIVKGLASVFALHPVATTIILLALVVVFPSGGSRTFGIITFTLTLAAASITTLALFVDWVFIGETMSRVRLLTNTKNSFDVSFGNIPWIVFVACMFLWGSVVLATILVRDCCGCRSKKDWHWKKNEAEKKEASGTEKSSE